MTRKKWLIRLAVALASAALAVIIVWLGWLDGPDGAVSDAFYQHTEATDGEIVLIGMDARAIEELGPMPWNRSVMAEVIGYLNQDPDHKPAVIGIDVLYVGPSSDPDADDYLAEMAAEGENVVVAAAVTFGDGIVEDGDRIYLNTQSVRTVDLPYPDLGDVTRVGHINALPDEDNIIRHARLYVDLPEGERLMSFSRVIYEAWCEAVGEEPGGLPDTDSRGMFYLPYKSRPGGYDQGISVADILAGEIEPEFFEDKVVLIGPYAAGMQDEYRTSIDHPVPMYGVEIQANQIDAFREGFFPKEVSILLQYAVLFLFAAGMFLFFLDRRVIVAVPVWLGTVGLWFLVCRLLFKAGLVLHVLWVPLLVTVMFVVCVAANYIRAAYEKRKVTNTFGRYVDPAIMRQLLDKGGEELQLGGKMYNIAVLFVDIRGFTTMSESLDPPTVVEIINMYLTLTTECIMRYHGTLDKFVGDCTMAFWNAPLPQEDPVYLACCAAMDMVEGSKALGEELMRRFGRTVSFGIGVHVGPAVVGNIGAPKRMDYTAIGDTVNTSSRLESNAPAGTIFISREVADALGDRAQTTSLGGSIKLKGKAEGFEVLTLDHLDYQSGYQTAENTEKGSVTP